MIFLVIKYLLFGISIIICAGVFLIVARWLFFSKKAGILPLHEPLFGLVWILLLICMFLPMGGIGDRGHALVETGFPFLIAGIPLGFFIIGFTSSIPALYRLPLAIYILMSDVLFITSPIILRWSLSSTGKTFNVWLAYASLNLICVILFMLTILIMPLVGHIDPNNSDIQLLPGFVVWAAAQVILTVAAALKL